MNEIIFIMAVTTSKDANEVVQEAMPAFSKLGLKLRVMEVKPAQILTVTPGQLGLNNKDVPNETL